jgi:outer membrane protein assembly factor BamA
MNKIKIKYWILIVVFCIGFNHSGSGQLFKKDSTSNMPMGFLPVPTFDYNRSLGFQAGAIIMYFNKFGENDTLSPPSTSGIKGFYTTNKSWSALAFQRLFFKNDNYRLTWALGTGDVNFQFYTEDIPGGSFIDYTTTRSFFALTFTRRVYSRLYMGIFAKYARLNTEYYLDEIIGENVDSLKNLVGLGLPVVWDSRDNIFNPERGIESKILLQVNNKVFGSDLDFNAINLFINYYKRLNKKGILASRSTLYYGMGEVPFEGTKAVGNIDIRGYSNGEFRGDQVATIQSEYRGQIKKRWGYVGFFGLAAAFNTTSDEKWSGVLPGVGAGIRWMVMPDKKINLGIDAAVGKDDWGIYFRLGEAF